jgi:tRNA A58 N-methylase Trm61
VATIHALPKRISQLLQAQPRTNQIKPSLEQISMIGQRGQPRSWDRTHTKYLLFHRRLTGNDRTDFDVESLTELQRVT